MDIISNNTVVNTKYLKQALSESFPWVKPLYDGCERNKEQWEKLAEQVEMGLTWIDHETIEEPVEKVESKGKY